MTTGREVEERRKMFRRWCLRHPFRTIWRAWLWWRWKRIPPWRLRASMIAFINPVPLSGPKLEALRALVASDSDDDDVGPPAPGEGGDLANPEIGMKC